MDDKELHALIFSSIKYHNDTLLDDLLEDESGKRAIDMPGEDGNMPLHLAVMENDLRCVECLLKHGANPNVFDTIRARTPLHLAVELGQIEIVKAILKLDHVNLDVRDDRNLTCYEIAQFCDNQTLAEFIKIRSDEINQLKNDFYSVLNQACISNEPNLVKKSLDKYEKLIIDKLPQGWLPKKDSKHFARSSIRELINWSSSSWNDVTLLFKSASKGHTEICKLLIEYGATAKCNENTNYSPLYVAAYGGFTDTLELLLENFPTLISEVTIEKWTVLHACCLQGHSETAKLVLTYPFLDEIKRRYVTRTGTYEYNFAFDLNAQDAAGQTVIYLAVSANNEKLLDTLLNYNVEAKLLDNLGPTTATIGRNKTNKTNRPIFSNSTKASGEHEQDDRLHSNYNLDKIIRKLSRLNAQENDLSSLTSQQSDRVTQSDRNTTTSGGDRNYLICPFDLDTYCDYNSKTALHLAVTQQYHSIATTLLVNGSNPNLPILSRDSIKNDFNNSSSPFETGLNWLRSSKSTCLKEACRLNDELMCDILIRYGASDNQDNLALQMAASNKNNSLISKFLALKSNVDPEYKINKKCNVEFASRYKQNNQRNNSKLIGYSNVTTTFSSMFPSTPVMIDWQNLKCMKHIDPQWLIDASLIHNKRLKHQTNSLIAITRLDLSSNNLKSVHPVIFRLPSLRELNLSKNRIETLHEESTKPRGSFEGDPTYKLIESHRIAMKRSKSSNLSAIVNLESSNIIDLNEPQEWDLPHLEILDLHDNGLISLPDCLFNLPKLTDLDVSNNQIRQLPWSMWTAPELREVIASKNLLDDLPKVPPQSKQNFNVALRTESSDSPTFDQSSLASNKSPSTDKLESSYVSSAGSDTTTSILNSIHFQAIKTTAHQIETSILPINHLNSWNKKIDLVSDTAIATRIFNDQLDEESNIVSMSKITYLNLSHNYFTAIPSVLACVSLELTRLNLSYNRITSLGSINQYPFRLKNLDLSNNLISSWFTPINDKTGSDICYGEPFKQQDFSFSSSKYSVTSTYGLCCHKSHERLDNLKSFNISHNSLPEIKLKFSDEDIQNVSIKSVNSSFDYTNRSRSDAKESQQLLYPSVTALDLSHNKILIVPTSISDLKDLSVLNLSGNASITTLPAELGLAAKLWNLGIVGCNLTGALKSIIESKSYKTMDIIGYLRSILEEAKPYARMKLMLVGLQGIGKTSLLELMRHEGTSGVSRRRTPEHWTKRIGHSSKGSLKNQRGVTLSTVGIDIHDWIFWKRTPRNQQSFGPVSFSTWDFGGQHEFYATHRYFLSRRSMYLVVWRLTDGIKGIQGIQQWLVNIQSRASGSPVIIVGTHEDMVEGGERGEVVQHLQSEVFKRFINISDHDKCGLPRVVDSIVVSTKTKLNIKHLCNRIYDIVFSLKSPGSIERLLEQKIPATYLYLEEIISWIVHERQQNKREPVLTYEEYRKLTSEQLKLKYNKTFRDLEPINSREINYNSELQQATRFLHENGILLHYEDANLRDLYFLDPQWLCDILSHVVTIREINPHVRNGLMRIDDLGHLFKSIEVNLSGGMQSYVVNLLNKFEVALTWNSKYLLIPSLLPSHPDALGDIIGSELKMVPRTRGTSAIRRYEPQRTAARASSIDPGSRANAVGSRKESSIELMMQPERGIYRAILLRYLPAGFLSRLQSGILSDLTYDDICADLHQDLTSKLEEDLKLIESIGNHAGWTCWTNGIKLSLQHECTINTKSTSGSSSYPLFTIEEFNTMNPNPLFDKRNFKVESIQVKEFEDNDDNNLRYKAKEDLYTSKWMDFDVTQYSNILLFFLPHWKLKVTCPDGPIKFIEPNHQNLAKLVATCADHIDNLLEDWYPSLGTRFAHTLGGNYLVTRILPCSNCLTNLHINTTTQSTNKRSSRLDSSRSSRANNTNNSNRVNFSINSSNNQQRDVNMMNYEFMSANSLLNSNDVYCYYVEHCILNAYNIRNITLNSSVLRNFSLASAQSGPKKSAGRNLQCPKHGAIVLSSIAPDVVFSDIPDSYKIDNDKLERCKLIGRGTFGFVFKGSICGVGLNKMNFLHHSDQEVAMKLLQPVDPGPDADSADVTAYKIAKANWTREPFHSACKSYCTARHEVNILQTMRHPNIVLFIGLCVRPLAIVLELAPLGCLTDVLKNYKRASMRIDQYSIQKSIIQIAKALEFLHQQRIIYRDLKSENILVWSFPSAFATQLQSASVELKLADYGISRQALSTGIWKGFAGTINFLAPEILRHNGDEEYTEKVDCFSFGMFMYELLTLRSPSKLNDGCKNHFTDGNFRPILATRDLIYPDCYIDLMSACWSQEPHRRPSASQIVSIASSPEFIQLLDAVEIAPLDTIITNGSVQYTVDNEINQLELWLARDNQIELWVSDGEHWIDHKKLTLAENIKSTGFCVLDNKICLIDDKCKFYLFERDLICSQQPTAPPEITYKARSFTTSLPSNSAVKQMLYISNSNCIILLLTNGQLWLQDLDTVTCNQLDGGSCIFESVAEYSDPGNMDGFLLYCGQNDGISCLEIVQHKTFRQHIQPLANDRSEDFNEDQAPNSSQSTKITNIAVSRDHAWTSADCTIHLWSNESRCVERKLDCWKLVPCSESFESINIEEYCQEASSSKVISMVYLNNQLYVGTSFGCFMVVEADSLNPMIVFRPYESNITIIAPTCLDNNARNLITIGSGYREVLKRYINSMDNSDNRLRNPDAAVIWSANYYDIMDGLQPLASH